MTRCMEQLKLDPQILSLTLKQDIKAAEKELDDDAESIITNERYIYIVHHHQELLQKEKHRQTLHFG